MNKADLKERKDRLHQNYLRCKANGKQKEWEERYNVRRKAQVEAAGVTEELKARAPHALGGVDEHAESAN